MKIAPFCQSCMSGPNFNYIDIPTFNTRQSNFHNIIVSVYDSLNNIVSIGIFLDLECSTPSN